MAVCRAWNRLFFFWLELEESMDNEGKKWYTIRPRYLRTKMNGLMGDVLSPRIAKELVDVDDEVLCLEAPPASVETKHPSFDGAMIRMEYSILEEEEGTKQKYGLSVSNKLALFEAVTETGAEIVTQPVAGFRNIASLDLSLKLGELELEASPSMHTFSFSGVHGCLYDYWTDMDGSLERPEQLGHEVVGWRQTLTINLRYLAVEPYGALEFQVLPSTLTGEWGPLFGRPRSGDAKFGSINEVQPFVIIKQGNFELARVEIDNIIPCEQSFTIDDDGKFELDSLPSSRTYVLPGNCWEPGSGEPLCLSLEVRFKYHYVNMNYTSHPLADYFLALTIGETSPQLLQFTLTCRTEGSLPRALAFSETEDLGCEGYLYFSRAVDADPGDSYVALLHSEAMGELARSLPVPEGQSVLDYLFTTDNQLLAEGGVNAFYAKLYTALGGTSTNGCTPESQFHFDGSFGLYGWELFYHIPALVASRYLEQGNYDGAVRWFHAIYDPTSPQAWNVLPLRSSVDQSGPVPEQGIADPDELAIDNPVYYQQATIRQYLEMILAAGDEAYRRETQESLQQAKLLYVSGKHLFGVELGAELATLTLGDWTNPTLGAVTAEQFRPPYNQEIRELYRTFEERLHHLRHWLSIDGQPLNIALLAPPINPRELQLVAQARRAGQPKTEAAPRSARTRSTTSCSRRKATSETCKP